MLRHLPGLLVLIGLSFAFPAIAWCAPFEVTGIKVSIQSENAVKARDQAIVKAQRIGFATLAGVDKDKTASVTDAQISRLVRGFSVQGERVASRTYSATFSIRFSPNATLNAAADGGFSIQPTAQQGSLVASQQDKQAAPAAGTVTDVDTVTPAPETDTASVAANTGIIVLPVLDIGARRTLWDEPNPWRETWQAGQNTIAGTSVIIPLGDISDVSDVPDAGFLNGGTANFQSMIDRYKATKIFVVVAKNQSDGMLLSLYSDDGQQLTPVKKQVVHPRPGFLFDDAVPAAIRMMAGETTAAAPSAGTLQTPADAQPMTPDAAMTAPAAPMGNSLTVTVPYQSLRQWMAIQKRLRLVTGVRNIMPVRLSPSSAQVKIATSAASFEELQGSMAQQGFDISKMPDGEIALTEK